jgi:hypothetical protein
MSDGDETQMQRCKNVGIPVIAGAFAQGAGLLYAGKQPQILMKFALTLRRTLS